MLRAKGIAMIIVGSMLWGLTGPIMEWILGVTDISVPFLLTVRLTLSGILLLSLLLMGKKDIFAIWRSPSLLMQLIIFSLIGVLGLQYSFMASIDESNSVFATLFQFSAPIIIVIYVSLTEKEWPPRNQVIGIMGTLIGLFLLLTNGSINNLLVSNKAIILGIGLGIAYAFYTLYPARLIKEWGILMILGWGMVIGGIIVGVSIQVWNSDEWIQLVQTDIALITMIYIILGTIAYFLFLSSLKYISPVETSILSSVEPLTVMIVSILWFGTTLASAQLLGVFLMLTFVTWLSIGDKKKVKSVKKTTELSI